MAEQTPPPTANTTRPTLQERAARMSKKQSGGVWGFMGFLFRAVTLVAVALGGVYFYQNVLTTPGEPMRAPVAGATGLPNGAAEDPAKAASTTPKAEPEDVDAIQRRMEFETAQGVERQQLATAKLKQRQAIALGESVERALDEWKAELEQWSKEVVPLSRNDQGKALAANNSLLRQYRAVIATERPGRDEARRLKEQVEGLISVMKAASENPADASLPGTEITEGLQGLLKEAKAGRDRSRDVREQVASLVTQAADEGSKGEVTLAEAAQKQQDEERRASAAVIDAERLKAEEEATRAVATAKADQARMAGQKQEELIQAETRALIASKESETRALIAKKGRERIRRLAEDPAIQAQFSPFLAHGKYQYGLGAFGDLPGPASYQMLVNRGQLKDVTAFAHAMAGHAYSGSGGWDVQNDRPCWSFPTSQAGLRQMEPLLNQFKELAPTWVEMGKLLP